MAKYEDGTYHKGYFCGVSNIDLNLIIYEDHIFISEILRSYVFYWYHTYLFHPIMDRTEAMIRQHFYWPSIRNSIRNEVTNCDTYQCTKLLNIKYGKLPSKEAE